MSYKTIFTAVSDSCQFFQIDAAATVAAREDAHLHILTLGVDHSQAGYYFPGGSAYTVQEAIDLAMEQAEKLEEAVRAHMAPAVDLRWSIESAVAQIGGLGGLVGMRARFST